MAQLQTQLQPRYLRELLRENQEPFVLETYIASKRSQLKTLVPTAKTQLQLKKRKPTISTNSNFATKLCKSACFFSSSFHDSSPDPTRSPLYYNTNFPSPSKSPCKNTPNSIFLHIPAKTSALLLEAALRIHENPVTKSHAKNAKYGILGSLLKRLTNRSKTQNRDFFAHGRDSLDNKAKKRKPFEAENHNHHHHHVGSLEEKTQLCPCNSRSSRTSTSGVWTEESHVSSRCNRSLDTEEIGLYSDDEFCESPFRFVLQRIPSPSPSSSGTGTPEFASSPSRHKNTSDKDVETLKKLQVEQEEEEDKEQCSPVSVLDPPFKDDDEAEDGRDDHDGDEGMDGYNNYKTSYAIVQRAKENLLRKLSRFERLAGLDPVELEKRLMEDDDKHDDDINLIEDEGEKPETNMDRLVKEILNSSCYHLNKIPNGMVRLVADLIREEDDGPKICHGETGVRRRVCRRLESWKEVNSNTIDMMVEEDFRRELKEWEKNQDQVGDAAKEIEIAIFGTLVEEMSQELVSLP